MFVFVSFFLLFFVLAKLWPSASNGVRVAYSSKYDHLSDLSRTKSPMLSVLDDVSRIKMSSADSALAWAEVFCLLSDQEQYAPRSLKTDFSSSLVGVTNNASSACHLQSDMLRVLIGYLSRRYQHEGMDIHALNIGLLI